ncbi:hypothetical protein N0V88_003684 [Collariella sp. IMI 366227]|nr:hypothetical protein N0V88_003684 [Collariella sp. IMI 366227]
MIVPRSSGLSSGALAGAVVGSVVGALLIAFCVFPFIVRARRRRLAQHDGDPGLAEMGQGPGGPIFAAQDLDDASYKKKLGPALPQGVTVQHGLPSPISSPTSPTSPAAQSSHSDSPGPSPLSATAPTRTFTQTESKEHHVPRGTVDRSSTRDFSVSDSYAPPSRQLTGITTVGITEEPESFDHPSGSPDHGSFVESLRTLIHRRRSSNHRRDSQQQRRDSRRSTLNGPESARSASLPTNDVLQQPVDLTPSGLEIDTDTPGLAWDYYNDPTLGVELSDTYPQSTLAPTSLPPGLFFAPGQIPLTGAGVPQSMTTGPITEEPDSISESDPTAAPGLFTRQNTLLQGRIFPGTLLRTDSLPPPTIVADLPSPPLLQYSVVASGNPMEMMKPTNSAESAFMLEHEMRMLQNSQPMPLPDSVPTISMPMEMDEVLYVAPTEEMKPQFQNLYQSPYETPYQSPPPAPSDAGMHFYDEPMYYQANALTAPDYSTPPPSTGPSAGNTPDTRLTPYTTSPSPPAEPEATINNHLMASPGPSSSLSPASALSPSPGASPGPSPGRSPGRSPARSQGRSPGRSPARPPGGFVCPTCGAIKASYHEMNHHERYHKRPFPCTFAGCERSFGTVTHLNRHINDKHQKTRAFFCPRPDCIWSKQGGKDGFPRKDNWKRHMMKKHGIDPKNLTDEEMAGDAVMVERPASALSRT